MSRQWLLPLLAAAGMTGSWIWIGLCYENTCRRLWWAAWWAMSPSIFRRSCDAITSPKCINQIDIIFYLSCREQKIHVFIHKKLQLLGDPRPPHFTTRNLKSWIRHWIHTRPYTIQPYYVFCICKVTALYLSDRF